MQFIERELDASGNVIVEGTLINKELLQKANWREDDTLSFKVNNNSPASKIDETQIYTDSDGKTFLVPPGENRERVEIGRVTGTTVSIGGVEQNSVDLQSVVLNLVYPVGAIYMSASNVSPQVFLGGTWVAWGAGRVPLAVGNNGETNYTASEATGGSENSVASHNHPQDTHTHTQNIHTHTTPDHTHTISASTSGNDGQHTHSFWLNNRENVGGDFPKAGAQHNTSNQWLAYLNKADNNGRALDRAVENHSHSISVSQPSSGGGTSGSSTATNQSTTATNNATGISGGNRQPFITCYMWKRVA